MLQQELRNCRFSHAACCTGYRYNSHNTPGLSACISTGHPDIFLRVSIFSDFGAGGEIVYLYSWQIINPRIHVSLKIIIEFLDMQVNEMITSPVVRYKGRLG
jgi:hypothetical protein